MTYPISKSFHTRFNTLNNLSESALSEWLFHPGMLFGSDVKWWGDGESRDSPHEGLDFRTYKTRKTGICNVDETTLVPVLFNGEIVNIISDFLGQSVVVRHNYLNTDRKELYTIYGHIILSGKAVIGDIIREDTSIGSLAASRSVPPHLHVSIAWVSGSINPQSLNWKTILDTETVTLIDPLAVIACPYSILD